MPTELLILIFFGCGSRLGILAVTSNQILTSAVPAKNIAPPEGKCTTDRFGKTILAGRVA
jgi:hypothetical protein